MTNVVLLLAKLLAFSGSFATDPMKPPFLENCPFAWPDAQAQLGIATLKTLGHGSGCHHDKDKSFD
jgi:hypothetical protein